MDTSSSLMFPPNHWMEHLDHGCHCPAELHHAPQVQPPPAARSLMCHGEKWDLNRDQSPGPKTTKTTTPLGIPIESYHL